MAQRSPQGPPWQTPPNQYPPYGPPPGQYWQPQPSASPPPSRTPEDAAKRRRYIRIAVAIIVVGLLIQGVVVVLSFGKIRGAAGTADVHAPFAPNSAGTLKQGTGLMKTRVTILTITGNQSMPNAGEKQITVDGLVENTGRFSVTGEPWKLRGTDDHEYDPSFPVGVTTLPSHFRLSSGKQIQGTLVFIVPTDVTVRSLRYGPHIPLNPNLYFDAP